MFTPGRCSRASPSAASAASRTRATQGGQDVSQVIPVQAADANRGDHAEIHKSMDGAGVEVEGVGNPGFPTIGGGVSSAVVFVRAIEIVPPSCLSVHLK